MHASPVERGWVAGAVALDPDELRADDVAALCRMDWRASGRCGGFERGTVVRDALTTLETTGRAASGGPNTIAVVPSDRLDHLPAFILGPSDPVRVGAANRALEHAGIPWRYGAVVRAVGDLRAVGTKVLGDDVTVSVRYELEPHGAVASDTLARVGAAAWSVAGPGYVLLASPIDPTATSLPIRRVVRAVGCRSAGPAPRPGAGGGGVLHAAPGATLPRPQWADSWEPADGAPSEPLTGATIRAPATPGVAFLRRGATRVGALVVDGEPRESDLRRLPSSGLASLMRPIGSGRVDTSADPWVAAVFEGGGGRPLATPFFLIALTLLVTESMLTRRRSHTN